MKYTIITGGSSGLGFEIASRMAHERKNIILIGQNEDKLQDAADRIKLQAEGANIIKYAMNIAKEEHVEKFLAYLSENSISIEFLFNIAGTSFFGSISQIKLADINKVLEANLIGLMLMSIQCAAYMQKYPLDKQRIVSVLSTAALKGKKYETIYNASKWGARGFLESLKDELSQTNIDIINVFPGGMKTPFWNNSPSGYNTASFMDAADVAKHIVDISLDDKIWVSDITINRLR